jgi:potassium-dependent mechanosensitive channel
MRTPRISTHLLCCVLACAAAPAAAHQLPQLTAPAAQPPAAPVLADTAPPPLFEVVTRYRAVMDSAAQAERAIARLAVLEGLTAELEQSVRRTTELQALLAALVDTDYARPERLSRLRDQASLEDQRLEALQVRTFGRLDELGQIRGRWLDRQRFWRSWRTAMRDDPDFASVAADMQQAVDRIEGVLERVSTASGELIALQRRIEEVRGSMEEIGSVVASLRVQRRQALLHRGEPALLGAAHREQLATQDWRAWSPAPLLDSNAYFAFLRSNVGTMIFQLLLLLGIGLAARRIRAAALPEAGWSGLLEHPWTLATFTTAAIALQRVVLAPPLWDVLLWSVLGATGAILAGHVVHIFALRVGVYLLAVFYPFFLLLEMARVPTPVFRLILAMIAACVMVVFGWLARRTRVARASDAEETRRVWPLRIGAALWAAVLLAIVLGYDVLGRWVLHATVTSAAVVFVVVLLVALLRGAIATLLRVESSAGGRILPMIGVPLAQRVMTMLQVILVGVAILALLDTWEITPSPVQTWQIIINAGFTVAGVHITVGRILFGAAVIYIAMFASWVVRAIVQSEVYQRWDFDRGVGDSINTLVHYTLITFGVFVALGVLGVELQNFAIVVGALGIGIGFGLQNVVNNFVSGLILLFERPVRVGDTVVVDGEWGTIRKIGLRSTIMQTFDQSEMIVPNADLVSEKVVNWTLSSPIARIILPIGVAYGSNIGLVLELLRQAGAAHDSALVDPPPQSIFVAFGDSSLDFELRIWIREIRLRLEVRSVVLTEVERLLTEHGIEIPFPQRDLHIRSVSPAAAESMFRP